MFLFTLAQQLSFSGAQRLKKTVFSVQCTVFSVQCTVFSVQCSVGAQPRRVEISKQLQWAVFSTQLGSQ